MTDKQMRKAFEQWYMSGDLDTLSEEFDLQTGLNFRPGSYRLTRTAELFQAFLAGQAQQASGAEPVDDQVVGRVYHTPKRCTVELNSEGRKLGDGAALYRSPQQAAWTDEPLDFSDYEQVMEDHRRHVRELDLLLNGEDGAAEQASLADLIAQVHMIVDEYKTEMLDTHITAGELREALTKVGIVGPQSDEGLMGRAQSYMRRVVKRIVDGVNLERREQAAGAVPDYLDGFDKVPVTVNNGTWTPAAAYAFGWNDCRRAMLDYPGPSTTAFDDQETPDNETPD